MSVHRVAAFAKRLLQLAATAQPNWTCGALLLLSQVRAYWLRPGLSPSASCLPIRTCRRIAVGVRHLVHAFFYPLDRSLQSTCRFFGLCVLAFASLTFDSAAY